MFGDETMQVMKQSCCRFDVRDNVFAKSRSNVIRYVTTSFGRSLKHPIFAKLKIFGTMHTTFVQPTIVTPFCALNIC